MDRLPMPVRSRLALDLGQTVAGASKLAGLGTGSVIGGTISLRLDPSLLRTLARRRRLALVSGTNGKTTATRLLAAALGTMGEVASNHLGANMVPGVVAALGRQLDAPLAALEVDERWLPRVLGEVGPATVVLLNLSRDQLDRSHEVRKLAGTWREALERLPVDKVVANADDPLVVWAAHGVDADARVFVAMGNRWTLDAAGCPACSGRIRFDDDGWACADCDLARPDPDVWIETDPEPAIVGRTGWRETVQLGLPGVINLANAAIVVAAGETMGGDRGAMADAVARIEVVAGRYRRAEIGDVSVRMLLAKNPAGWQEAIDMLEPAPQPVVAAINARIADGRDPSWLWDVPFERLAGRFVVATGERRHDLAVRLRYAEVDHATATSLTDAVALAARRGEPGAAPARRVGLIANYTAFQDYLDQVGRERDEPGGSHRG